VQTTNTTPQGKWESGIGEPRNRSGKGGALIRRIKKCGMKPIFPRVAKNSKEREAYQKASGTPEEPLSKGVLLIEGFATERSGGNARGVK